MSGSAGEGLLSDDTVLKIKWQCNGMLHESVYRAIYEAAASAAPGTFVEVGTAHGAATVCLALGKRHGGRQAATYTVERIVGGSREEFGTFEENAAIIRGNFSHFGVAGDITLLLGDVAEVAHQIPIVDPISLLMLDADGRIDRDFALFYNHVRPGGTIIIDDYADLALLRRRRGRSLQVDLKQMLAYHLVNYFVSEGLLNRQCVMGATFFGEKPVAIKSDVILDLEAILKVYGQLVSVDVTFVGWRERSRLALAKLVRRSPALYVRLKRLFG